MVQNLPPGATIRLYPGQIRRNAHVYRTSFGYNAPGTVIWQAAGQPYAQILDLAVGGTVTLAINGQAGFIANNTASRVQVLWDNGPAVAVAPVAQGTARALARGARRRANVSSVQPGMSTLTKQWYNAVTGALSLDRNTFQLAQGMPPIGSLSTNLWNVFDAVPPLSLNQLFDPAQVVSFSAEYGGIISNLNQPGAMNFQTDMGDYYVPWSAFLATQTVLPSGGLPVLFQSWSQLHMPAGQAAQCYTDLVAIYQGPVLSAQAMWVAAGGASGTKAYTTTYEQATSAISNGQSNAVGMSSATQSSDVSDTWAQGEVSGSYDFFEVGGEGEYDDLTAAVLSSGLTINASFQHVAPISAGPLSQASSDPILSGLKPWYNSAALELAYQNNQSSGVWKNNPPTWDNEFGPGGSLLRTCSTLLLVSEISVTITSSLQLSESDQQRFQTAVEGGVFPFFFASASGGYSNSANFDSSGTVTISSTSPPNDPLILGVTVTPISAVTML